MVLAVNWPPQEPADGTGDAFQLVQVLVAHLAGAVLADAFEHIDDGDVACP